MSIESTISTLHKERLLTDYAPHSPQFRCLTICLLTVCSCGGVIPALTAGEAQLYAMLALFHDIGKQAVPSEIRNKHMDNIAAIDEILAEGIADAQARAAQDFATTGGDNYEIVQPFTVSSNTNSFIGQYCAAKEQSWAEISLEDLKQLLRAGRSHLYSFTRTSETRTVEADDPDTPDVVETKTETWYIYTLVYNGEAYFADQVFHLTDNQKALAGDYAQNLSLFLSDGSIQYTEYSGGTIAALGDVRFTDGATGSTSTSWISDTPTSPTAQTTSAAMAAAPPPWPSWCPP